jgi:putative peptidoglycan lipid II flippase
VVGAMTFTSRILGFIRDIVIARYFGADALTDAFFVAFRIPNFLRRLFAEGSFSQAFIPILSDCKARCDQAAMQHFVNGIAGSFASILLGMTLIGMIAAPLLILLFAPGFYQHGDQYRLGVEMLRITFPYLFFISLTAFAGGILNTWGYFAVPALTPALLNIVMIAAAVWLSPLLTEPVTALAWGVLLAGMVQLAVQIPALSRAGLLPKPRLAFSDPGVQRVMKLIAPAIFGVSVTQLNLLINTLLASFLVSGSVSWLYYSDRLVEFPLGIFGVAIGTAILPHLSNHHVNLDGENFSRSLDWALRWVMLIGLPATFGLMLLAEPLMMTLFQYDQFSLRDAEMSRRSLATYSAGLIGLIALKVLIPGFSARQDLRTPARYAIYTLVANILLSLILVWILAPLEWGHAGLALASSLSALLNAGLLLWKLWQERVYRPERGWVLFLGRLLLANVSMGMILNHAAGHNPWQSWTSMERITHLSLWILMGFFIYWACLWITGLRPMHVLLKENA